MAMLGLSGLQVEDCARKHTRKCEPGRLDVWLLSTRMSQADREIYEGVLTSEEKQRVGRFHFDADRARSIAGRGGLRWILSAYCGGIPPGDLMFETGLHGKPALIGLPAPAFNVSHSGECVLIGIMTGAQCGVDIERKRSCLDEESIAQRFFCQREVEWLRRTKDGFLRLWTAKEAIIKAVGGGLSIPLTDVDVTDVVDGKTFAMTLKTPGTPEQVICLRELELATEYTSAVAVTGEQPAICLISEEISGDPHVC